MLKMFRYLSPNTLYYYKLTLVPTYQEIVGKIGVWGCGTITENRGSTKHTHPPDPLPAGRGRTLAKFCVFGGGGGGGVLDQD
jgi:hypothetical protein